MHEIAVALITSDQQGMLTLDFQVAHEVLTEKDFAERYRIVSVGGVTTWSSHTENVNQPNEHLSVDQVLGLVVVQKTA